MNLDPDPSAIELHSSWTAPGNAPSEEPVRNSDHLNQDPEVDPVLVWAPSGRRLISGLLGINVVLLGAALVGGQAFNRSGLKHQEPQVFLLLLMGISLVWMLWYLLWARKQPGICPHKDHHAGGLTVTGRLLCMIIMTKCTVLVVVLDLLFMCFSFLLHVSVVLLLFAACSLLLFICRTGYLINMVECKPAVTIVSNFIEAPFLGLQVKICIFW